MSGDLHYRHAPDTVSRLVAGEVVIVRVPDGEMTVLNESGGAVWCAADGTRRPEEIAGFLAERYRLAAPPDVRPFLGELAGCALLVASEKPLGAPAAVPPFPAAGEYAPPALRVRERLETLASICDSSFGGYPNCMLEGGGCLDPW